MKTKMILGAAIIASGLSMNAFANEVANYDHLVMPISAELPVANYDDQVMTISLYDGVERSVEDGVVRITNYDDQVMPINAIENITIEGMVTDVKNGKDNLAVTIKEFGTDKEIKVDIMFTESLVVHGNKDQIKKDNGLRVIGAYNESDLFEAQEVVIGTGAYIPVIIKNDKGEVVGQSRSMPVPINEVGLSENDKNLYKHIEKTLPASYKKIKENFVFKVEAKTGRMSESVRNDYINALIDEIETQTFEKIISKYPADKALPEKVNNQYLTLKFITLELQQIMSK